MRQLWSHQSNGLGNRILRLEHVYAIGVIARGAEPLRGTPAGAGVTPQSVAGTTSHFLSATRGTTLAIGRLSQRAPLT